MQIENLEMVRKQAVKKGISVMGVAAYFFVIGIFFSNANAEPKSEKIERKLDRLNQQLLSYSNFLERTDKRSGEAERLLRSSEKELNIVINNIEKHKNSIKNNKRKITLLEKQKKILFEERDLQAAIVTRQIRLEYQRGNFDYLKFLLSQESLSELSRMNSYFQSLNNARLEQLSELKKRISQIERIEKELQEHLSEIETDTKQLVLEQASLQTKREKKKGIVRQFQLEIEKTRRKIEEIEEDKETLIAFLTELRDRDIKIEKNLETEAFSKMRGKLNLPVEGKILHKFGETRGVGALKWQGLFIQAKRGSPVKSIYPGTVIFSDWFRGLGLLIIIKHDDGFMSLYAHNETLKKNKGDIVSLDEHIATTGNSGGQQETGVYLEIRVQGEASNPIDWFAVKNNPRLESKLKS